MLTLRVPLDGGDAERTAITTALRASGTAVTWHDDETLALHYGICACDAPPAQLPPGTKTYEGSIIVFALTPSLPEAIPPLLHALGGAGRPAGVHAAFERRGSVVIESDWSRTPPQLLVDLADVELRRFGGARVMRTLTPLPVEAAAAVAGAGLSTPEIAPSRILDVLLERAGVTD